MQSLSEREGAGDYRTMLTLMEATKSSCPFNGEQQVVTHSRYRYTLHYLNFIHDPRFWRCVWVLRMHEKWENSRTILFCTKALLFEIVFARKQNGEKSFCVCIFLRNKRRLARTNYLHRINTDRGSTTESMVLQRPKASYIRDRQPYNEKTNR